MKNSLALYVHIPFCVKKCSYCDFVSFGSTVQEQEAYVDLLLKELSLQKHFLSSREIHSIFIGGGTPSILSSGSLSKLLRALQAYLPEKNAIEFTVECNCESVTKEKLDILRTHGVNRLSLGLQSTIDRELTLLGRPHNYEDFLTAFQLSRQVGFSNINVDLMFHLPGQTPKGFALSLNRVVQLSPQHISCYSLILEEGTPLENQVKKGALPMPNDGSYISMYRYAIHFLKNHDFHQYEFSNFARPGLESTHNCSYWKRQDYLGLGLSAHSFIQGMRFCNPSSLHEYAASLKNNQLPHREKEVLTTGEAFEETLFLGLRMNCGISMGELKKNFPNFITPPFLSALQSLQKRRLILLDDKNQLSLTQKGIEISNTVFVELMTSTPLS